MKALQALLETAAKFSAADETVRVTERSMADAIQVVIESRGLSIPPAALPKFFEVFSIADAITPGGDLGLDAPVAHRILTLFGGAATVENQEPPGIQITVSLRRTPKTPAIHSELAAAFQPA